MTIALRGRPGALGWWVALRSEGHVEQAVAYSTLAMTVGLAVTRPRVGFLRGLRITPGIAAVAGVVVLLLAGLLQPIDMWTSARLQWRPLVALTCIMVMTGVVKEVGAFDRIALRIEAQARATSTARAFDLVFLASVLTPSVLNNDAAILLLTPVVVALVRRLYPNNPKVMEAFVFAVFLAPGVAPFIISNPMNMVVAEYAGLDFNAYALVMAPIAAVGAVVTYAVLRFYYRDVLSTAKPANVIVEMPSPHRAERPALAFMLAVFLSYPLMAMLGGPMWVIALTGALGSLVIAQRYRVATERQIASHVSVDILVFLWGVFLVVAGLRNVGVVDWISGLYGAHSANPSEHLGAIGVISALGSALVDNHPMALLNMMALESHGNTRPLLAALIGGDLGPRLLPIGSLASLLWLDLLRRRGVEIGIGTFVKLGAIVLLPALAVSLAMLCLM